MLEASLIAPGATEPTADPREADPFGLGVLDDGLPDTDHSEPSTSPPRVPRYATLQLPDDVRCSFGQGDPVQRLRMVDTGPLSVTCAAGDETIGGLTFEVVASSAQIFGPDGEALTQLPREATPVRLVLDPPLQDVSGLTVLAPEGVTLGELGPHADGGLAANVSVADTLAAEQLVLRVATADESHLPIAETQVGLAPPPNAEPVRAPPVELPLDERVPDPHGLQEAFGLSAFPSWVGLRDERRSGSGMHLGVALVSAADLDPEAQLRLTGGARAALFDDYLRLDAAVPLDLVGGRMRTAQLGSRDVYFAASSRLLNEGMLGLAVELGIWTPTASDQGLDRGRLQIAADFSLRFLDDDRLAVRTRQAGIFDLVGDGSVLWASAYGFDVWIIGPLSAGVELDLVMGREDLSDRIAAGVGAGVALDFGPVSVHAGGRFGFGDDPMIGRGAGTLAVRGSFR